MDLIISQIRQALRGIWHYRWWGLAITWAVGVGGAAFVLTLPNRYEATARVYVDTQSILKPLLSGLAVQPNTEQQVGLLSRTLLSRPTLEKLVRATDLDAGAGSRAEVERILDGLASGIKITSTGRDNLYTLSFQHGERERAQRVVQAVVSNFVESGIGRSRTDSAQAKKFIDEQIKAYEEKLVEAENRRKEFRLRNIDITNPDGKDSSARLGMAIEQYERARLELREAENARNEAKRQMEELRSGSANSATQSLLQESAINIATPEIDARIDAQRKALDGLLLRYTEAHPDVANGRTLLKSLEEQKRREMAELRRAALAAPSAMNTSLNNPAMAEVSRLLAGAEVQVAGLKARVEEYSAKVTQARSLLKVSPEIEAQSVALDRDYALNRKSYEDLLSRRQSAELTGELDEATGLAEFRVIDPPRVSDKPVSPNRLLLMLGVLAAALGAGVGAAFVIHEIRPIFSTGRQLADKLKVPLLGVVGLVPSPENLRAIRVSRMRFYALAVAFITLYLLGLTTVLFSSRNLGLGS